MIHQLSENEIINNGYSDVVSSNNKINSKIHIMRSVYDQQSLHDEMMYSNDSKTAAKCGNINGKSFKSFFLKTFPILSWLYSYKREYLLADIISGLSVVTLHIPGMGHALLAYLPPVVGIYMGFYPVIIYGIFSSSKHNAIGINRVSNGIINELFTICILLSFRNLFCFGNYD